MRMKSSGNGILKRFFCGEGVGMLSYLHKPHNAQQCYLPTSDYYICPCYCHNFIYYKMLFTNFHHFLHMCSLFK